MRIGEDGGVLGLSGKPVGVGELCVHLLYLEDRCQVLSPRIMPKMYRDDGAALAKLEELLERHLVGTGVGDEDLFELGTVLLEGRVDLRNRRTLLPNAWRRTHSRLHHSLFNFI